ncbi:MAG: hypothetical protein COZ75_12985 [Flavobacteriaceae bacterium CG_4_8_14_3_um_filter_34_10]|nr:MAG: hypothetical protein COZ75_12985 [Flavobacteriaceae bacterium CG_4_8_14_3_um_filter_34_10]
MAADVMYIWHFYLFYLLVFKSRKTKQVIIRIVHTLFLPVKKPLATRVFLMIKIIFRSIKKN